MFHIGSIGDTKAYIDIEGQCKTFFKKFLYRPKLCCVVVY